MSAPNRPKRIAIIGSTGSIGTQAIDVVQAHPSEFVIVGLAAGRDSRQFREQVRALRPRRAVLATRPADRSWVPEGTGLEYGTDALCDVASDDLDLVLIASTGTVAIRPTLAALRAGVTVALANKESLVAGGHLVMPVARQIPGKLIPVDSEHSAIWQCLEGEPAGSIRHLILTASGGAFRDVPLDALPDVSPERAKRHPNWQMGPKITVDSATLMNKGLEVLEAAWLFDVRLDQIEIVLHRESIVHSLVEFVDGSVKAQLSKPDMRMPIQHALTYPARLACPVERLNLIALGSLNFAAVDPVRFRCAFLAIDAGRRGGSYPAALNAADEAAVSMFLDGRIRFTQIADLVDDVMQRHIPSRDPGVEELEAIDLWARTRCARYAETSARVTQPVG
jgi:1-deoxy-D-xylulose-5-phosphate reductoisomerase